MMASALPDRQMFGGLNATGPSSPCCGKAIWFSHAPVLLKWCKVALATRASGAFSRGILTPMT